MFKPKRKHLAYTILLIFVGSSCYVIGISSNGSDPTWDEVLGIFNVPWVNTSIGVDTQNYYRDGENYTLWIETIGGGVSDHGDLTGLGDDDHPFYLNQDGLEGLTGDWDVGEYDITAKDITADEFYRTGSGNYTQWILDQIPSIPDGNYTIVEKGDVEVGSQERLNFIEGENVTLTIVDDPSNNEVDITISSTGGSQGPPGPGGSGAEAYPYTYLIFKNATSTYVLSGDTGQIVHNSGDDDSEINWAISSLDSTGGKIILAPGDYILSNTATDEGISDNGKDRVELCGYGRDSTVLWAGANQDSYFAMIDLTGSAGDKVEHWYIHDLTVHGDHSNQVSAQGHFGIDIDHGRHIIIDNVIVNNTHAVGGDTTAGKGIEISNSNDIEVTNCIIVDIPGEGFALGGHNCLIVAFSENIRIDNLYAEEGSDAVTFYQGVNNSIVSNSFFENQSLAGLQLAYRNSNNNTGVNVKVIGPGSTQQNAFLIQHGSYGFEPCSHNKLLVCEAENTGVGFVIADEGYANQIIGCSVINAQTGLHLSGNSHHNIITNFVATGISSKALYLQGGDNNIISDVLLSSPTWAIREESDSNYNVLSNVKVLGSPAVSVRFSTGDNNKFYGCDFGDPTNTLIDMDAGANNNEFWFTDMTYYKDGTGIIDDGIGNVIFHEIALDLVDATEWQSTVPFGGKIDATTEYVLATAHIPEHVLEVVKIKVYGIALEADADGMTIEIEGYGWSDNEIYTTETIAIATLHSTSTGFSVNEGIYWTATASEATDIDDIVGGDWIMIKIIYEDLSGASIATNVTITTITVEVAF